MKHIGLESSPTHNIAGPEGSHSQSTMNFGSCRFCGSILRTLFCDLGVSPLSNAYLTVKQLDQMEPHYPLRAYICENCFLGQVQAFESPENIFGDYAYCSSYSDSWLQHAKTFATYACERFALTPSSFVVEVASNDGYLLKFFKEAGVPILGIEPAANIARMAQAIGIPTYVKFFGEQTARALAAEGKQADLLVGNNVLAHVPDLNDFVNGLEILLKPEGVLSMEFPHMLSIIQKNQFDTIYHEHFSYFSLATVQRVFDAHGLEIFDVEQLSTHGGSLRILAKHKGQKRHPIKPSVSSLIALEKREGLQSVDTYKRFDDQTKKTKRALLEFLIKAKDEGKSIAGYGAPAKGNTLLNYCGIRTDLLDYTVDRSPQKQGCFLPGTHIPIYSPDKLRETKPDLVLILPWNIQDEIISQWKEIRNWGGQFLIPIPSVKLVK